MKEQSRSAILPPLPIVGTLKLTTRDGKSLSSIDVVKRGSDKELDPFFEHCFEELELYLTGQKQEIDLAVDLTGLTDFQKLVLKNMKKISFGKTASYREIAEKMKSRAYQAIGSACGRNPFLLIYPCHRIVGAHDLGGFAHGVKMKQKLLDLEAQIS